MQRNLFPGFAEDLGPTTDKHLRVIVALDMIEVEKFILYQSPGLGKTKSEPYGHLVCTLSQSRCHSTPPSHTNSPKISPPS